MAYRANVLGLIGDPVITGNDGVDVQLPTAAVVVCAAPGMPASLLVAPNNLLARIQAGEHTPEEGGPILAVDSGNIAINAAAAAREYGDGVTVFALDGQPAGPPTAAALRAAIVRALPAAAPVGLLVRDVYAATYLCVTSMTSQRTVVDALLDHDDVASVTAACSCDGRANLAVAFKGDPTATVQLRVLSGKAPTSGGGSWCAYLNIKGRWGAASVVDVVVMDGSVVLMTPATYQAWQQAAARTQRPGPLDFGLPEGFSFSLRMQPLQQPTLISNGGVRTVALPAASLQEQRVLVPLSSLAVL